MIPNTGRDLKRQVRPSRTKSASRQGDLKHRTEGNVCRGQEPAAAGPPQKSGPILGRVVAGYALDAADGPLLAAEDRMFFPLGESRLSEDARLHGHVVLDDDFLAANRLADGAESMAHDGNDGDLHWLSSDVPSRK